MQMDQMRSNPPPWWFWTLVLMATLWNVFGVVQFISMSFSPAEELQRMGLSAAQASLYAQLPMWMDAAFAIGVFGSVLGSMFLLARQPLAKPVLLISLVGYLVLYLGDIGLGVFAAFGLPQVIILTFVLIVAATLLWLSYRFVPAAVKLNPSFN